MPQRKPVSACSWRGCLHPTHMRIMFSILTQEDEDFLIAMPKESPCLPSRSDGIPLHDRTGASHSDKKAKSECKQPVLFVNKKQG